MSDDGDIEHSDNTKQFIVEKDSEIRFRLRRGSRVSNGATLLVNKAVYDEDRGDYVPTVTQPIPTIIKDSDLEEFTHTDYRGSKLDYKYLDRVEPLNANQQINLEFRVRFEQAGSFFVQVEYFDSELQSVNYSQPTYINVEPVMVLGEKKIMVKQLSIITVLSRCLGQIERWEEVLSNLSQLSYNAVHFTPIQRYGWSYSHYSLADQTIIDDYYFGQEAKKLRSEDRIGILKQTMDYMRKQYGLFGIIDIVLNHTASNSEWLLDHPEAGYNTDDCPHLKSAFVLDKALSDYSDDYAQRKIPECPSAPYVNNEADLKNVMTSIQNRVISKLNFHEYFMFKVDAVLEQVRECIRNDVDKQQIAMQKDKFDRLKWWSKDHYTLLGEKFIVNLGAERYGAELDLPMAVVFFYLAYHQNEDKCISNLKALLTKHNEDWKAKVNGYMKEALLNLEGNIKYFKLELKEPKITKEVQLVRRYFTELENDKKSKVAHNGWIMNHDPMQDFAITGWHYLRRNINIWSDSVKLRYGKCPADSPYLWSHMSRYVTDMSIVFDGFRLDNAHSTPIHVCYYLLQVARTNNPNLFVMAELFTSSAQADALFVQKLNLNGLVRELQNTYTGKQLGEYFHQVTCREAVLGLVDPEFIDINGHKYKVLKPKKPHDIIYDQTHDNPSPAKKFQTPRIALPHIGVASLADQPIASTWGYDLLLPESLNVVTEKRLYCTYNQDDIFKLDNIDPDRRKGMGSQNHHRELEQEMEQVGSPEWTPEERKTDFEHEFIFNSNSARRVQIAGCFTSWKPIHDLVKIGGDQWRLKITLPIIDGQDKYEFKFVVNDSEWQFSQSLPSTKDKSGNVNNYIQIPDQKPHQEVVQHQQQTPQNFNEYKFPDIRYARRLLNEIHYECTEHNAEIFLHQQTDDVLVVIRQFQLDYSNSFDAYVSITRHCYFQTGGEYNFKTSIELPGYVSEVVFAGYLEIPQNSHSQVNDPKLIKGLNANFKVFKDLGKFCKKEKVDGQEKEKLSFFFMPPSFTCVVKTRYPQYMKDSIRQLNILNRLPIEELSHQLFFGVPLSAFNHLLFRCDNEEKDISNGKRGPYGLSKYGSFVYSGLTSFMHILRQLKVEGDMGHELFDNMRDGNWLIDYTNERLGFMRDDLHRVIGFLTEYFNHVKRLHPTFKPKYGSRVIEKLYASIVFEIVNRRMTDRFVNNSEDLFIQRLALGVVQMYGRVPSAEFHEFKDSMCAGLPHFSTGYTRCWGRDTFIALRGLLIVTGLEKEARDTIMYFARIARHGLIPNLHDRGNSTRFNARDAVWFFLQAIKDYVTLSKTDGASILKETLELHFRDNDQRIHLEKMNRKEPPRKILLQDLIQEMLQAHAQGIEYREWNAGPQIDSQMKSEGFNVKIQMDTQTGFCFGGNQFNCGTWMDKMGSSEKTGNKGIPATPRDGAPIELVAMQYSVLRFMESLSDECTIENTGVRLKDGDFWTYKHWADLMKQNFERCFWVPLNEGDYKDHIIDNKYVCRKGIYKDVFRPSNAFTEYQLRPNLCVAMSYAPDLFVQEHARICLENVEKILMEPNCMGIKTLDPSDKNYKGNYVNSDDSCGWNYHQGPEWLWPVGFFLKAKMIFSDYQYKNEILEEVMKWVKPHQKYIMKDVWEGLPELTNSHGTYCKDSCETQAWSISTINDALRDLYYL